MGHGTCFFATWREQIVFEAAESQRHRSRYSLTFLGFTSESLHFGVPSALPLFFSRNLRLFSCRHQYLQFIAGQAAFEIPSCCLSIVLCWAWAHLILWRPSLYGGIEIWIPFAPNCQGKSELTWFGWSSVQALQPASVHSSATALFLSRKISYAFGGSHIHIIRRILALFLSEKAVGPTCLESCWIKSICWEQRGQAPATLGTPNLETCYAATQRLDLFEIWMRKQETCHLPGCLWNGWSTACSTLLLLVCLFRFQLHVMIGELSIRFVRQLAQLGAPRLQLHCLFQHFWLTTMPSLFAQKLKVKWLADTRSPFCYCIHIFFTESCKLGSVLLPVATSRGREGFLWLPKVFIGRWDLSRPNGSRCLVSAHCNHFRLWSLILNIFLNCTAQHYFLMIAGCCDSGGPVCFKSILVGAVTIVFELWVYSWAPDLKQLVQQRLAEIIRLEGATVTVRARICIIYM